MRKLTDKEMDELLQAIKNEDAAVAGGEDFNDHSRQGDRVISDSVSEARRLRELHFHREIAAAKKQGKLATPLVEPARQDDRMRSQFRNEFDDDLDFAGKNLQQKRVHHAIQKMKAQEPECER